MKNIYWTSIQEQICERVFVIVQEGYVKDFRETREGLSPEWRKVNVYRALFRFQDKPGSKIYTSRKPVPRILIAHQNIFKQCLKRWAENYQKYMTRVLTLKDFKFIVVDKKNRIGYLSFKTNFYEICIDEDKPRGWLVCLASKNEEVLDETIVSSKRKALKAANKFYMNFGN